MFQLFTYTELHNSIHMVEMSLKSQETQETRKLLR